MQNNTWVFFILIMIIMKTESLVKLASSLLRSMEREAGQRVCSVYKITKTDRTHIYTTFFHYFWTYSQLPKWVPQVTKHPIYISELRNFLSPENTIYIF